MLGGNMRQCGPLAAAGIVALQTMVARLAGDHANAKRLAIGFAAIDGALIDPAEVETNLVKVVLPKDGDTAQQWSEHLERAGIRVSPCERYALRFVTHRHIDETHVDECLHVFEETWRDVRRSARTPRAAVR
jgi:threonine aldolase